MKKQFKWKCQKCGLCCEDKIPFDNEIIEKYQGNMQRDYRIFGELKPIQKILATDDGKCVFLMKDNRCAIYSDRPELCRKFGEIGYFKCLKIGYDGHILSEVEREQVIIWNRKPNRTKKLKEWNDEQVKKNVEKAIKILGK